MKVGDIACVSGLTNESIINGAYVEIAEPKEKKSMKTSKGLILDDWYGCIIVALRTPEGSYQRPLGFMSGYLRPQHLRLVDDHPQARRSLEIHLFGEAIEDMPPAMQALYSQPVSTSGSEEEERSRKQAKLNTMADFWEDFAEAALPENPLLDHKFQVERAFFAGAYAYKCLEEKFVNQNGSEDILEQRLLQMREEVQTHINRLIMQAEGEERTFIDLEGEQAGWCARCGYEESKHIKGACP